MPTNTELITIIVPCHNESANIQPLYQELTDTTTPLPEEFEFIFVDDGSRDDTVAQVRALAHGDERIRLLELARNFGKEVAITAGLHQAKGVAAITIDADLQHPPPLIPELIAHWRQGYDVVVGVRRVDRKYASIVKRWGSHLFYRIMNTISEVPVVPNATDYRMLDRVVIDAFACFTERNRLTRGLIDWLGFRRSYVEFTPDQRRFGEAGYSFIKLLKLAVNSFISMSLAPLKLAGYLGLIIMFVSGPLGLFILVEKYLLHDALHMQFSGPAILAVILLFLVGIILSSLGLMSLYVASIHTEVMNRPLYVVRPEGVRSAPRQSLVVEEVAPVVPELDSLSEEAVEPAPEPAPEPAAVVSSLAAPASTEGPALAAPLSRRTRGHSWVDMPPRPRTRPVVRVRGNL